MSFTWKARKTMAYAGKRKLMLKLVIAAIWTIVLPTCYAHSKSQYTCFTSQYSQSWLRKLCLSPYLVAVGIYLIPNAIEMVLFFVPVVRKYIETSNSKIFTLFSWTQVSSSQRQNI